MSENQKEESSVYVRRRSRTNVSLNFQGRASDEFDLYADTYREAAGTLFDINFEKGTRSSLDALPIGFLYRHAIELFLKAIARKGATLFELYGKPQCPIRQTHSLTQLLADVKPVFEYMGPQWERLSAEVSPVIADLNKDDELGLDDQSGDMWRYPVRKSRKGDEQERDHLPVDFTFDVREFVMRLDKLTAGLSNACVYLDMLLDHAFQLRADYDPT